MDIKKIEIDGKEVEVYTGIEKYKIENNDDIVDKENNELEDTLDLTEVTKMIESSDNNG